MKNNLKREFHGFVLTDYEKEEEYLRKMHKSGWRLVKVTLPVFYYFEPCTPEDVVYKLDFNPQKKEDRESYLQMYADYDWEYLQDLNEYSYFRKPADEVESNNEIFSDNESKLEMLKRILHKRMLPLLTIFLCIVIPQFANVSASVDGSLFMNVWLVVWCILLLLYIVIIGRCAAGFQRLSKKYSGETK